MTDILSHSPWAKIYDLPPAERQAAIARRQHERREDWCDDARRARDYQAELAEMKAALNVSPDVFRVMWSEIHAQRDAALARIAELEAALEPFASATLHYDGDYKDDDAFDTQALKRFLLVGDLRRARSALRNHTPHIKSPSPLSDEDHEAYGAMVQAMTPREDRRDEN